jgi:GT2 family glycosyltransferase
MPMMQTAKRAVNEKSTAHRPKIAVLLTCFNRRQKTIDCIDAIFSQSAFNDVELDFFVTDDGSKDGTSEALIQRYPKIRVLKGNGALYWNGGMRLSWAEALKYDYDFYLWMNDDTFLYPDTIQRMLVTHARCMRNTGKAGIIVGSTHDDAGQTSYGGELQKDRLHPLTLVKIEPTKEPQQCDTFNGNCVLVPREVTKVLGNLDAGFVHAMGDTDYGLRAKRSGIPMWVMPSYAGRCVNDHQISGSFSDRSLPVTARIKNIMSPKGLPWRAWLIVCRRHAGFLWPVYWLWPYLKILVTSPRFKRRKTSTP